VIINKMVKGTFNRPHSHPRDRTIYVVDGTWWVGRGPVQNVDTAVATPAGTYVKHVADQIHWDGAKDEDVVLLIGGQGPAADNP
jgi:quercetin dioxygenase-like cupin family protein